jgi:two-component system, OmpR family, KDP operon response regulator KdpE
MTDTKNKPVALVIDDENQIRRLLQLALDAEGYIVHEAASGQEGLAAVAFRKPDVIILDLGLPDLDGMEVLKRLREWSKVPVLVLTVRQDVQDKVAALDLGADDYLTKPFHAAELAARLRAIRRHSPAEPEQAEYKSGSLYINFLSRKVVVGDNEVHLTATEYALLRVLVQNEGKVVTHRQLLRTVWGPNSEEQSQYLRVYMNHLRKKIEINPAEPHLIKTEPGIGYRLVES